MRIWNSNVTEIGEVLRLEFVERESGGGENKRQVDDI